MRKADYMKRIKFFEKPAGAKTIYIMAGVSFCLAAIAVAVVYSGTMNAVEKNLTQVKTTYQVDRKQQGEEDPRVTQTTKPKEPSTTEKTTAQLTTQAVAEATEAAASTEPSTTQKQSFILPCEGEIIREYSPEIPVYCETMQDWRTHSGVDFLVKEDEEVLSVGKGRVSKVMASSVYGYIVEVDYGEFTARYCGMKQGECVGINQLLNKGDSVGKVGEIPCEAMAEKHLHFEIIRNGDYADPIKALGL